VYTLLTVVKTFIDLCNFLQAGFYQN